MKHWVFDLDGTWVDSFSLFFDTMRSIFERHGAPFGPDLHYPVLTEFLPDLLSRHIGADAVPSALQLLQERSNADAERIRAFAGMTETIQGLAERGARIAVWTNRDLTSARLILEHSGLGRFAEACVSGSCVALRKPHPEGLQRIIQEFGCPASEVVMVGDHEHDVEGAKAAGARAVRASWHGYWPVDRCSRADHQFFSVADFDRWTREIASA